MLVHTLLLLHQSPRSQRPTSKIANNSVDERVLTDGSESLAILGIEARGPVVENSLELVHTRFEVTGDNWRASEIRAERGSEEAMVSEYEYDT